MPASRETWAEEAETSGPVVSLTTLTVILAACVLLWAARDLFLPLAIGMLITFILSPVVDRLNRMGLNDGLAVLVTVMCATALVVAFLLILGLQLGQIAANLPQYQGNVLGKIDAGLSAGKDSQILGQLSTFVQGIAERLPGAEGATTVAVVEESRFGSWASSVILPALAPVALAGILFVTVTFALIEREALRDRLVALIGGEDSPASARMLEEAGARVSTYLSAQLLVNVIYAVPIWLGLWVIGLPNAAFFGMVTLVLRFLPYIGSALSAGLPLLMAFAVSPDWSMFLWTAALFATVELVTSNLIEPFVYGQRTGLSPLAVVISALFWTWLWGPLGLIMATPLTVCLVVAGNHVPGLRLFSILFGDRQGKEDPRWLYDQLLAGRRPQASAEALLAALARAQADHGAGLLSRSDARRVAVASVEAMTEPEGPPLAVVPGRARFDAAGARILSRGEGSVLLPESGWELPEGVAALVVVALDGRPAMATIAELRRLREARPDLALCRVGPALPGIDLAPLTPEASSPDAPQPPSGSLALAG